MNIETFASPTQPLWKSQLARWLRREDPDNSEERGVEAQERRAPQAPARQRVFAPPPPRAWPRVFPGL